MKYVSTQNVQAHMYVQAQYVLNNDSEMCTCIITICKNTVIIQPIKLAISPITDCHRNKTVSNRFLPSGGIDNRSNVSHKSR